MDVRYIIVILAAAGGLWLWQRYNFRATCERVAGSIESMRRRSLRAVHYVPVDVRDPRGPRAQRVFADATGELEGAGCKVLGDLMEQNDDGSLAGVVRWFRNGDGSVCGWFGIARHTPVVLLFSESASGDYFVTGRGSPEQSLARPPNVHRAVVRWGDGMAGALQHHLELVGARADELRRVDTVDDAVALLGRLRSNSATWRAAQPEAALLEADLRSMLSRHYDEFAPGIRRALAARTSAG